MSSATLAIDSFIENNLRERTELDDVAAAGAQNITVKSTANYSAGDTIYVGNRGQECCEKAVIQSVTDATHLALTAGLAYDHSRSEAVTSVLGDQIRIYRAANVDGTVPADSDFTVLTTISIDSDQLSTYYKDATGGSGYWYKWTNYNATGPAETDIADATAVRGQDYGHYASLPEIRKKAGFENNFNLQNSYVDQFRQDAEDEINSSLATVMTTPFSPVPSEIKSLTLDLATGLLWRDQYGDSSTKAKTKLADARAAITAIQNRQKVITGTDGSSLASDSVDSYPTDDCEPDFTVKMRF